MSGPFFVGVDWAKNGNYTSVGDDVTDRVRPGSRITASYGRDQNTALSPIIAGRGSFDLDNTSRDYSPRNAASPLFGNLKPARPVIIQRTVNAGQVYFVAMPGETGDYVSTPDTAVLDITGDIDLRAKIRLDDWTPAAQALPISKLQATGSSRSYQLGVETDGKLKITWTTDGSVLISRSSTVPTGFANGTTHWIRVTLDVDNGASGHDANFYTSTDGTTWTKLGDTVTTAGTTSIFAGTDNLEIGARTQGGTNFLIGGFYEAQIHDGISGSVVTHPIANVNGISDSHGLVYTLNSVSTDFDRHTILVAHTTDDPINPDIDSRTVSFSLEDALADFHGQTVSTALYQGIRTGEAIGYVLDAVGWSGGRDLDPGVTYMPWWWEERTDAFEALVKLLNSEGPPALLSVGVAGEIIFRDRHHRLTRAESLTSQATWRGTLPEPVMGVGFSYDDAWRNIVNSATFSIGERTPQDLPVVVWEFEATIDIPASSTVPVAVELSDPVQSAITPSVGFDLTVVTGTVTPTLSRDSGTAITIFLAAGGADAQVIGLRLRAVPVPVVNTVQISATDSSSQTDYGLRSYPNDAPWAGQYDAKAIADLQVATRKQPNPILTVRFPCTLNQDTRLTALLARDLSDRVTVVEPETAVNSDFFLESFEHSIDGVVDHQIVVGCEAVPPTVDTAATMFRFDSTSGHRFDEGKFAT